MPHMNIALEDIQSIEPNRDVNGKHNQMTTIVKLTSGQFIYVHNDYTIMIELVDFDGNWIDCLVIES